MRNSSAATTPTTSAATGTRTGTSPARARASSSSAATACWWPSAASNPAGAATSSRRFLRFGEEPRAAARREIREETGLTCGELTLLDVYNLPYRENEASLSIVFLAREWTGEPEAADDAAALVWQPLDVIEGDRFAWRFPGLAARLTALAAPSR